MGKPFNIEVLRDPVVCKRITQIWEYLFGVPRTRIRIVGGLYWGPLILGNYPKPFFEKKYDNAEAWVWALHGLKVRALRIAGLGGMGLGLRAWGLGFKF